ncbi:GNAT family N-acetyltransferase [Roseofilum casamattae]|uniref:GNAT family N-acetyltransferase n=1 Tax=Roseofilum casamattae BLCC-M143 TaxID=3022442 RepID=A0ABT7C0U3_9CYAN|nr:GNAT family N-acetyltransferase [Roseofilum casamattae]MDJ1184133.1 GNAT family N-acetyltransferase [Roseofilum casamattae BLCC-M143]
MTVTPLKLSEYRQVAELLIMAFGDRPNARYMFRTQGEKRDRQIRLFFESIVEFYRKTNKTILGIKEGDRVIGAAIIEKPQEELSRFELLRLLVQWGWQFGLPTVWRISRLISEIGNVKIPEPNYYLIYLVVHPQDRGRGHGRDLLEAVHDLSQSDPISTGTMLDTEVEHNVELYQYFGYCTYTKIHLENNLIRMMFRPDS